MKIRRLDVDNFRGIRALSWRLPVDQGFFALIGPGDATKSTILTAIERGLSDRWNIVFIDTDFYKGDTAEPIRIRIALSDLPPDLLSIDELGLHLAGIDAAGDWTHDPEEDGYEPCVIVELRVEADLEPQWVTFRPGGDDEQVTLKARHRARFGAFRVDERVDTHLRWSRMSALGKLTNKASDTKSTLTVANRAAQAAATAAVPAELQELAGAVGKVIREIGSAEFRDLRPGLDLSLTNAQGNLALFDGPIPLTNFGLGTRRLAAAAVQQVAHDNAAILMVDEVEYGLEPHRLMRLLHHVRRRDAFSQVFITTHSPTALQYLEPADLVTVRSSAGDTQVRSLREPEQLKAIIKSTPQAFLARRVVVCEGKTEYGLLLQLIESWDPGGEEEGGELPAAALGVVGIEGGGGMKSAGTAMELLNAGYEVVLFMDSDDRAANEKAACVAAAGGKVVHWPGGMCTESAVCNELSAESLSRFIRTAVDVQHDDPAEVQRAYAHHLQLKGAPTTDAPLDISSWMTAASTTLENARAIVGSTAGKSKALWFKRVDPGRALARFIMDCDDLKSGSVATTLEQLRAHIYDRTTSPPPADQSSGSAADEPADGKLGAPGREQ